jgi:peptidoglycan/LPS O-acetylase OafA/YrhL
MPTPATRIESLDGLRTVSILLVLISHSINAFGHGDPLVLGNLGVRVFFVISGFLITGLLLQELKANDTIDLGKFYFRRTLRIFPPFYFFLLLMFVFALCGWTTLAPKSFLPALTYTSDYISTGDRQLAHSWSLSIEEQFYLLWPGVLFLLGRKRAFYFICLVIVLGPLVRIATYHLAPHPEPVWLYHGFQGNMDALATGCVLAFVRTRLHDSAAYRLVRRSRMVFAFPAIILLANIQGGHPHLFDGVCVSVMNILIAIIIDWAMINHTGVVGRILNSRPFTAVGVMSYSIYLWQQPFLVRPVNTISQFLLRLVAIVFISSFSYLVVERLSLQLRKKLHDKWLFHTPEPIPATSGLRVRAELCATK